MGRKSTSNRMPKKSRPFSNADISGSSMGRLDERAQVRSPVKGKGIFKSMPVSVAKEKDAKLIKGE